MRIPKTYANYEKPLTDIKHELFLVAKNIESKTGLCNTKLIEHFMGIQLVV